VNPLAPEADVFEGVELLRGLIETIVYGKANVLAA
jgi:hypothetical protein